MPSAMSVPPSVVLSRPSVVPGGLLEQPVEVGAVELGDGPVVLLHRPGPEVEVDLADRVLDGAPQGPAVLRHQAPEAGAGHSMPEQLSVVGLHQLLELFLGEVGLAPEVAELEARV